MVPLPVAFHGKLASPGKLGGLPALSHTTTVGKLVTVLQLPKTAKLPSAAKPLSLASSPYLELFFFVGKLPSSATLPSLDSFRAAFLTKLPAAVKADMLSKRLSHEVTCRSGGKHYLPGKFVLCSNDVGSGTLVFCKVTHSKLSPHSWQLQLFGDVALVAGKGDASFPAFEFIYMLF